MRMTLNLSGRQPAVLALFLLVIILLPTVPSVSVSDNATPPRRYMTEISPRVAQMIRGMHQSGYVYLQEDRAAMGFPDVQEAPLIYYWRYVWAFCFVKQDFSGNNTVNWYYWSWDFWSTPELDKDYIGDCHFYVEYGAEYYGDFGGYVAMAATKKIADTWKTGMVFNSNPDDLDKPYYWVVSPTEWDCSDPSVPRDQCEGGLPAADFLPCDVSGLYNPTSGVFTTSIGSTGAGLWQCGIRMEILTKNGIDFSVLSKRPEVSHTITPVTDPPQIAGKSYQLRVEMTGFDIKSPVLAKQSSWAQTYWWLEGSGWQASKNKGMWLVDQDPYFYQGWWSGPYLAGHESGCTATFGCHAGVQWYLRNTWRNWDPSYPYNYNWYLWPPAMPIVHFPPSFAAFKYTKSTDTTHTFYNFGLEIKYVHKGISFIIGNDISFSGNPATVRAWQSRRAVQFDLDLVGSYPAPTYY